MILDFVFSGEAYLWLEEKEPGVGEVQVCVGLQDQGTQETDRTQGEWHQDDEGTDTGGGFSILLVALCR